MTEKAKAYVDSLNLDYSAVFIPHNMSRNANERPCLNWRVKVGPVVTDYSAGIAHIPGYSDRNSHVAMFNKAYREACKTGRFVNPERVAPIRIPPPPLTDVLYSLVMDASGVEDGFEYWARGIGYDTDSRKAERIYSDCVAIAQQLRGVLDLDEAREAFEDY